MDNWRKHKKALNAAKYYEELPATEKNSNQEQKVPIETKPDPKITKAIKINKKTSTISLPVTKQINNSESPIAVLNSLLPEVVKKPIASVAPYQIVLPKQTSVIVPPERTVEKLNIQKPKLVQAVQNKTEKESTTKSTISKKSISEDDGLLVEYKCMKKKNKTERKASLIPSTSPSVSQLALPVTVKTKVQTIEKEVIKPKSQTMVRCTSLEIVKPKVQTIERGNSPEIIKPKVQTVDRYNSSEVTKENSNDVIPVIIEKEKKEPPSLKNKLQTDNRPDVEKRITVLKRSSDEMRVEQSQTVNTNKHGNIFNLIIF